MRSPIGPGVRHLAFVLLPIVCVVSIALAEEAHVLLFDTETAMVLRQGPSELTALEMALVPQALGVGADREACADGLTHWLTPRHASRAEGAFTRPQAEQVLVSVRYRRCDEVEENPLPGALVLYEHDEPLAHVDARMNVYGTPDVDLDGVLEVLLFRNEFGAGSLHVFATLWSFAGGRPHVVHDFGEVFADYCGSYLAFDEPVRHTRVTYAPTAGSLPVFEVASRAGSCRQ